MHSVLKLDLNAFSVGQCGDDGLPHGDGFRIDFTTYWIEGADISVGPDQLLGFNGADAILQEVLICSRGELTQIIGDRFLLRSCAHLLECGDRHRSQKADGDRICISEGR